MKLSSLFKDKVYAFPQNQNQQQDIIFAKKILDKINNKLKVKDINVGKIDDNYDNFKILSEDLKNYSLKVSLDDSDNILKKEAGFLKNHKSKTMPLFKSYGQVTIGENVSYLLSETPNYESIRNYGRSCIIENMDMFFDCYFDFQKNKSVKPTFKSSLKKFLVDLSPSNYLPKDSLQAFESYTNYSLCEKFMGLLKQQIISLSSNIELICKHKCHGSLSLDSIFFDKNTFYFDKFHSVYMGHAFLDFIDLLLEIGIQEEQQYKFLSIFCTKGNIPEDRNLFNKLYEIQLRKKLGHLISDYIKEIYIYDSYRYDNILNIADVFSHCYERFCKIEIFDKNRDFIMKTICEPIFGVKA